jgi:hypothetical protein
MVNQEFGWRSSTEAQLISEENGTKDSFNRATPLY